MAISTLRCKNAQQNTQNKNISQTRTFRERKQPCFCNYIFCIVVVPVDNPTEFQLSMYHCIIVWSHVSSSLCVGRTISYTNCDSFATWPFYFLNLLLFLLWGKVKSRNNDLQSSAGIHSEWANNIIQHPAPDSLPAGAWVRKYPSK